MSDTTFDRSILGFEAARLLETLLERAGEDGRAQISTAALQKASGLTQGALIRARTELTQHGLLRTESGFSANGLRGANVYSLDLVALGPVSSVLPDGEPVQNRTHEASVTPLPGASELRSASEGGDRARSGFFSRLFRRSRAS